MKSIFLHGLAIMLVMTGVSMLLIVENAQAVKLNAGMSHSAIVTIPPVTTKKATSLCPAGQQVTGGGHMVWEGNVVIVKSTADQVGNQEAWTIEGFAPSGTGQGKIQAFAMCAVIIP